MSEENQAAEHSGQEFAVQRTYLKDLSLEAPMGTEAFLLKDQPQINQDLSTEINKIRDDFYETILKLTVTAKVGDEKTVFLVEAHQAGLFMIKGLEGEHLTAVLNTVCPQMLFPYACEAIDSVLVKATFPPLMMPPINFNAVYAQALAEQKAQQKPAH
ncbi:protein-export chaperone SecB [Candidatus Endobugula sertula]|uniref:Protein-export protein SecB n=1 Tax=Candidatus Endobugula sertula TaxID=62101 RepID=A0A1D2QP56_9GAMM|nr:protein-export chaperone SecB [Candidatus Endobugula sertula]